MTKIYADGCTLQNIEELMKDNRVEGLTFNPSLLSKIGVKDFMKFARDVLSITNLPVSFEVFSDDPAIMEKEANILANLGKSIYVKIPITNTQGVDMTPLMGKLSDNGIKINATAILTKQQINRAVHYLSLETPSIISVFAGRVSDTGKNAMHYVSYAKTTAKSLDVNTPQEILWASCRSVYNYYEAQQCGADIITMPIEMIRKLNMKDKNLTELSLETVVMFRNDAVASGFTIYE